MFSFLLQNSFIRTVLRHRTGRRCQTRPSVACTVSTQNGRHLCHIHHHADYTAAQQARGMSGERGGSGTMNPIDPEIYIPSPLPPPVMASSAFIPTVIAEPIPASAAMAVNNGGAMTVTTVHRPDGTIVTETVHPDGTKTVVTKTMVSPANNNNNANSGMAGGAGTNTTPQPAPNNNNSIAVAPTGQWSTELCSCFDVCCSGVWWVRKIQLRWKLGGRTNTANLFVIVHTVMAVICCCVF